MKPNNINRLIAILILIDLLGVTDKKTNRLARYGINNHISFITLSNQFALKSLKGRFPNFVDEEAACHFTKRRGLTSHVGLVTFKLDCAE